MKPFRAMHKENNAMIICGRHPANVTPSKHRAGPNNPAKRHSYENINLSDNCLSICMNVGSIFYDSLSRILHRKQEKSLPMELLSFRILVMLNLFDLLNLSAM